MVVVRRGPSSTPPFHPVGVFNSGSIGCLLLVFNSSRGGGSRVLFSYDCSGLTRLIVVFLFKSRFFPLESLDAMVSGEDLQILRGYGWLLAASFNDRVFASSLPPES
ncbi:hypothetical protein QL285_035975 [Trifolium repens]|nr:hypothetical protein QL285_035975 [Trifolium repens]